MNVTEPRNEPPDRCLPEPLRIAHVVFSFDYGGLERRILRLIDGFTPLGAEFLIVSLRHSDGRFLPVHHQVKHIVLNARPGLDLTAVFQLTRLLKQHSIDIVHSHNWVSMLEGIVAGRLARTPVVVHGEHGASRFAPDQLSWKRVLAQRVLARLAHAIIPVNENIRDRIVDVWKLPAERCTVIRNGVDTEKFAPKPRPRKKAFVVGSVSRLERIKNFPCLIKAVHALNQYPKGRQYELIIVGEGSERNSLEKLIRDLGAASYVQLPGGSDSPEEWYSQFDAYVNCSYSEGMSNTVLEAMACGLPVVVSDVAGHREWIPETSTSLFFTSDSVVELCDALSTISLNETEQQAGAWNNRHLVEDKFSNVSFLKFYRDLYCRLYFEAFPGN